MDANEQNKKTKMDRIKKSIHSLESVLFRLKSTADEYDSTDLDDLDVSNDEIFDFEKACVQVDIFAEYFDWLESEEA